MAVVIRILTARAYRIITFFSWMFYQEMGTYNLPLTHMLGVDYTCTSEDVNWKGTWDTITGWHLARAWPAHHLQRIPMDAPLFKKLWLVCLFLESSSTTLPTFYPRSKIFLLQGSLQVLPEFSHLWTLPRLLCLHKGWRRNLCKSKIIIFQLCKLVFMWSAHLFSHTQN